MEVLVFGHKNPDTDSICSSLVMADLAGKMNHGFSAKACRLGNVNEEAQFVLDFAGVDAPELIENVAGKAVILVDHNEFNQSADGIEEAKVVGVVDHHRVNNFQTAEPLFMTLKPVGCTCTVLYGMFLEAGIEISKTNAILMLSAIITDTLLFKSPTCTGRDTQVAKTLAEIAEVNLNEYGMNLLKAGTNIGKYSAEELLNMDAKQFETSIGMVEIAQVNCVDLVEFQENKEEDCRKAIQESIEASGVKMYVLLVTNVLESDSVAYVYGDTAYFEEKFDVKLENNFVAMPGVVSRKKQIVPFI